MAKVMWTFANTPPGHSPIGESPHDFRQYIPRTLANWRKTCGHSPIQHRTFANWRKSNLLSTIPATDFEILWQFYGSSSIPVRFFLCSHPVGEHTVDFDSQTKDSVSSIGTGASLEATFANSLPDIRQLARVHMTFASTPPGHSPIGEGPHYFRQYTPRTFANNWRKSYWRSSDSPIFSHVICLQQAPLRKITRISHE